MNMKAAHSYHESAIYLIHVYIYVLSWICIVTPMQSSLFWFNFSSSLYMLGLYYGLNNLQVRPI